MVCLSPGFFRLSTGRVILLVVVLLLVVGFGAFSLQVYRYYRAIRSGESNPFLEQQLTSSLSHLQANTQVSQEDLVRLSSASAGSMGNPKAKLTIVEFIDFDCPYSKESFAPVREMVSKYQDQVHFLVRDFPLQDVHPRALSEAVAARCAGAQGKFWAYHDKLFMNQENHADEDLARYAREVGADGATFDACARSSVFNGAVQQDVQDGLRADVEGTPTFFFNGIKVQGALDAPTLEFLIKKFLNV